MHKRPVIFPGNIFLSSRKRASVYECMGMTERLDTHTQRSCECPDPAYPHSLIRNACQFAIKVGIGNTSDDINGLDDRNDGLHSLTAF